MARPLREEFEGAVWHVTSRGNEKKNIFFDDEDRAAFLARLARAVEVYGWIIHAYVLMDTHVHLMIETPKMTLSSGMQWLNSCWAMDVNRRYERTGHLFGERFKAFLIDKESYYYEVVRYVILNPVRAGMRIDDERIEHPGEYQWSSYRATAGLETAPSWLAVDKVWLAFGQTPETAQEYYREFVETKLDAPSPFVNTVGQLFLGSQSFIEAVRSRIEKRGASEAHPREQREVGHASASQVGQVVCRVFDESGEGASPPREPEVDLKEARVSAERMLTAWLARLQGEKLRAIAGILGVTSLGHASDLVKRCGAELAKDPRLRELADRCRELIRELPPPFASPPGMQPRFAR